MSTIEQIKYIHRPDHGLTIAYVAEQLPGKIKVTSAYSIVSDKDKFNRKIGRAVTAGRLTCNRINRNYPHHTEFFLSGTLPTTGDKWREFESAVIAQTGEFFDQKQATKNEAHLIEYSPEVLHMLERASQMSKVDGS